MFNPRLYGVAQGSLIAKSIHQEDLQCNESSARGRRKVLPPKIASAAPKTFSSGRGGRGAWRGGRGLARGRGGSSPIGLASFLGLFESQTAVVLASSRMFQKSRPQVPYSSSPSSSSTPMLASNGTIPSSVAGDSHNVNSPQSGPHGLPSQSQSWKGKAVMPTPTDENPRPAKRRRMEISFPPPTRPYTPGPHCDHEGPSTRPTSTEDTTRGVNAATVTNISLNAPSHKFQPSLLRNSISNAKALATQRGDILGSSQRQYTGRLPPHTTTKLSSWTANNELSTISPRRGRAENGQWDAFQSGQSVPAEMVIDPAPTILPTTKLPSSRTHVANSVLPPALEAMPSYQLPRTDTPEGSKSATSAEDIASSAVSTRNVESVNHSIAALTALLHKLQQSLPLVSNANASADDQQSGNLEPSQHVFRQCSDRLPPHAAVDTVVPTVNIGPSSIPPWRAQPTWRKWDVSQGERPTHPHRLNDPASTLHYSTKQFSSRGSTTHPALLPAVEDISSYQSPRPPPAITEGSKRPQPSSSNLLLHDTKEPALYPSTTDASSHTLNATSRTFPPPAHAPETLKLTYEAPRRPQPKLTKSPSTMPPSSNVQRILPAPTIHVKKESPPSPPLPERSPIASPPTPVKAENMGRSLAEDDHFPVEIKDPIVIKQEPDLEEAIIPQPKLVTESCSFYPIPHNCRKSAPNYKNNRIEYFRKEYKRLREFGLTKQKVVFRDDGLAIEWISPIPVWSDTLLPEASVPETGLISY